MILIIVILHPQAKHYDLNHRIKIIIPKQVARHLFKRMIRPNIRYRNTAVCQKITRIYQKKNNNLISYKHRKGMLSTKSNWNWELLRTLRVTTAPHLIRTAMINQKMV